MSPIPAQLLRYCAEPSQMRYGESCRLLVGGESAFPAMLAAIFRARESIWLESYIFESDETGRRFVSALCKAARRGVEVFLLLDAFGALGLAASDEERLVRAGAHLRYYGRFNHLRFERWLERDHRKQIIIDSRLAFVGGLNFNNDYASKREGGNGWHDFMVELKGPSTVALQELFLHTWKSVGPSAPSPSAPSRPAGASGSEWSTVVASDRKIRFRIRRHLLHAIREAHSEILLASAYFVPDRGVQRALILAAERGVDVRVLVPGESDIRSVQWAGEQSYARLLRAGVSIYQWQGSHMHAKALAVDESVCAFGSYNLDYVSLFMNLELLVVVAGTQTPRELAAELRQNTERARPLRPEIWLHRPLHHRLRSRVAYQFRKWL